MFYTLLEPIVVKTFINLFLGQYVLIFSIILCCLLIKEYAVRSYFKVGLVKKKINRQSTYNFFTKYKFLFIGSFVVGGSWLIVSLIFVTFPNVDDTERPTTIEQSEAMGFGQEGVTVEKENNIGISHLMDIDDYNMLTGIVNSIALYMLVCIILGGSILTFSFGNRFFLNVAFSFFILGFLIYFFGGIATFYMMYADPFYS